MSSTQSDELTNAACDDTPPDWSGGERRDGDRRERPTQPWSDMFGPLRRSRGRRDEDRAGYVDRYSRRDVALILSVFILNVGDAFFTMLWLDRGGKEANPIMDFFLNIGPTAFLVQKCVVVGLWLVVLLVHKNFRFARIGLYVSLGAYAILMLIHFGIIAFGVEPPNPHRVEENRALHERPVREDATLQSTPSVAISGRSLATNRFVGESSTRY